MNLLRKFYANADVWTSASQQEFCYQTEYIIKRKKGLALVVEPRKYLESNSLAISVLPLKKL